MADRKKSAGKPKNLLPMAWAVFVAAIAAVLIWLSVGADDTIEGLRTDADYAAIRTSIDLADRPPPPEPPLRTEMAAPEDPEPEVEAEPEAAELREAEAPVPPGDEEQVTAEEPAEETELALVEPPAPEAAPELETGVPPWQAFRRPFDETDSRPRIAIVVTDLGLSASATQIAIQDLPGEVTLAFAAHASGLETWIPQARAAGHEALVMVPMEPEGYPGDDPGPYTLLTALAPSTNIDRLDWSLSRASDFVGIIDTNGSRFTGISGAVTPILEELGDRGLLVVDSGANEASVVPAVARKSDVPLVANDLIITDFASSNAIDLRLAELEAIAAERGWAVGVAFPYPVLFERLQEWIGTLDEKDLTLAPVTAVAEDPS